MKDLGKQLALEHIAACHAACTRAGIPDGECSARVEALTEEVLHLRGVVSSAVRQFAPHTTNSDADDFLARFDRREPGEES